MTTMKRPASGPTANGVSAFTRRLLQRVLVAFIVMANDTRTIELVRFNPDSIAPCEVQQKRNASRQTLWRAENDGEFCNRAYARYLERLSSLGFDCGLTPPPSLDRASAGFE